MKTWTKRTLVMLLALLMLLACCMTTASAASAVKVSVGGKNVTFNNDLGYPFIDPQNRTLVPFRAVANFMDGVEVYWDGDAKMAEFERESTVVIGETELTMYVDVIFPIGTNQAWVDVTTYDSDGEAHDSYARFTQMDTLSMVYNGRTYAPIRYLAEGLNYSVGWIGSSKTVTLTPPSGDWAVAFVQSERNKGFNIVTSDYEAYQYAYYYVRRSYNDLDPNITFLGSDVMQSGLRVWNFKYGSNYIMITQDGEHHYSSDGVNYNRWE